MYPTKNFRISRFLKPCFNSEKFYFLLENNTWPDTSHSKLCTDAVPSKPVFSVTAGEKACKFITFWLLPFMRSVSETHQRTLSQISVTGKWQYTVFFKSSYVVRNVSYWDKPGSFSLFVFKLRIIIHYSTIEDAFPLPSMWGTFP